MEFKELPNPYDFANPVSERELFVGRSQELREIEYYLDHAVKSKRPINLALIGARASGKTSMLNMIDLEAKARGFCTVRVNLDEGDSRTELAFFYKIFDAMLTEACSLGAYGGLVGKTYETYCEIVSTYVIPEDTDFRPFIFPIRYAKAISHENYDSPLPDTNFKRDIVAIQNELHKPIAILFDECDVLKHSRVHLQKLRNIFMDVPSIMLVLTGTQDLFPVIEDVFSPIIRQFKKISIAEFTEKEETRACILSPLRSIGIGHPSEIFDFETFRDVNEIHDFTAGRPYEIQLLCHFLFRRTQEGRAKRMKLSVEVLDDVLAELGTPQDIATRPVTHAVRNLDKSQLEALSTLTTCNGHATLEQLWAAEYIFHGEERYTRVTLEQILDELVHRGILEVTEQVIRFSGDDFDRVYCKYFARKHRVRLAINDVPYEIFLGGYSLDWFLAEHSIDLSLESSSLFVGKAQPIHLEPILRVLQSPANEIDQNPFQLRPDAAIELYWSSIDFRHSESFLVAIVTISTQWATIRRWFRSAEPKGNSDHVLETLQNLLSQPAERADLVASSVEVEIHRLPVIPPKQLFEVLQKSGQLSAIQQIGRGHVSRMYSAYLDDRDLEEAFFHGQFAHEYLGEPEVTNNLGYLYLASGSYEIAEDLLAQAMAGYSDEKDKALPQYNLAMVAAMTGDLATAMKRLVAARRQIENAADEERSCMRLFVPQDPVQDTGLAFVEIENPDLLETIHRAISTLSFTSQAS